METQGPKTPRFLPGSYLSQPGHNLRPGKRDSPEWLAPAPGLFLQALGSASLIQKLTGGEGACPPNLQSTLIVGLLVTLYPQAQPQYGF